MALDLFLRFKSKSSLFKKCRMNSLKKGYVFIILICLLVVACDSNEKKIELNYLKGNIWIYDSENLADSLKNFNENYLIFESSSVKMNGSHFGDYKISHDTLIIFQTSFNYLKGGKYQKRIINLFSGVFIKADSNQIFIKKISGFFPIKYYNTIGDFDNSRIVRLTNLSNTKKKGVKFKYISVASSDCYGNCPVFNIELDNKRNFKFSCLNNCRKIGDFQGVIPKSEMKKIEDIISYLNLKNDSTIFSPVADASQQVLKINVNNKEFYFSGTYSDFQLKMQSLINELYLISQKSYIKKTKNKLKFKVDFLLPPPPPRESLPPLPMVIEY